MNEHEQRMVSIQQQQAASLGQYAQLQDLIDALLRAYDAGVKAR